MAFLSRKRNRSHSTFLPLFNFHTHEGYSVQYELRRNNMIIQLIHVFLKRACCRIIKLYGFLETNLARFTTDPFSWLHILQKLKTKPFSHDPDLTFPELTQPSSSTPNLTSPRLRPHRSAVLTDLLFPIPISFPFSLSPFLFPHHLASLYSLVTNSIELLHLQSFRTPLPLMFPYFHKPISTIALNTSFLMHTLVFLSLHFWRTVHCFLLLIATLCQGC